ncbi:hypothetical protein [Enterococcus casseliflavus]|uniref:hypothetical protein n=1 Tax=Enterococcus casseliflavus TaxID=37734 RepID=UPI00378A1FA3
MIAKIEREAADARASQKGTRLGKETTEFPAPLRPAETRVADGESPRGDSLSEERDAERSDASRARKSRRYANRRTLWRITGDSACKGCGRALMDPASGVIVAQTAAGTSVVLGLMRCGRIWLCPVCAASIRHKRAEEITQGVTEWIRRGGTAYLVTFTARHGHTDRLADLMDALQGTRKTPDSPRRPGAYQRLITGGTWAGRRATDGDRHTDREGIRDRIGYVGMIRATEVTVGQINGWHPHLHAIVLVGGHTEGERGEKRVTGTWAPSEAALDEWQGQWRSVWTRALRGINPDFTPDQKHGVDFKLLKTERDANDLAEYIAKTQDGKAPALELARADLKAAGHGNVAPFELLGRIGDLTGGVPEDEAAGTGSLEWNLGKWHEYERATKGRRAIEWTRYLRQMLGIDGGDTEDDDLDLLLAADADGGELRAGVVVTDEGWTAVARRGLDLEATQAAEGKDGNTDPEAMAGRVREVLALADPTETVIVLTSGEVADAYAAMLEALALRREEAAARRRRENDDQEHDDDTDRDRAERYIARLTAPRSSS